VLYKTHCTKSAEALSQIGGFSADVILSIQQHHERLDGSGFPKGLSMRSIQPLALLIAVSDVFLDECYLLEDRSKVRIESILRRLTETHAQKLPADALLALCRVFRVRLDEMVTWNLIRGGLNIGS
jgi:HD-GYP domain-containing protein (c-di-GMP phosphodiesterase class II)